MFEHVRRTSVSMVLVLAAGLACKFYRGPASEWVNNWGPGSVCYVVLLMLIAYLILPRREMLIPIAVGAVAVTSVIEFSQLHDAAWLSRLRSTTLGKLVLGTTFSWWDFPAYFVGGIAGWVLLRALQDTSSESQPAQSLDDESSR